MLKTVAIGHPRGFICVSGKRSFIAKTLYKEFNNWSLSLLNNLVFFCVSRTLVWRMMLAVLLANRPYKEC